MSMYTPHGAGNPSGDATTFDSQSTFVLPYKHPSGKTLLIYLGDRWNGHGENGAVSLFLSLWLNLSPCVSFARALSVSV